MQQSTLAAIKLKHTLEKVLRLKGSCSLIIDSIAMCWHSISHAGTSLGSSVIFGCKNLILRGMSQQRKTRVSFGIGRDQTSHGQNITPRPDPNMRSSNFVLVLSDIFVSHIEAGN